MRAVADVGYVQNMINMWVWLGCGLIGFENPIPMSIRHYRYLDAFFFCIIIVWSACGNILVISAVYKDYRLHTVTNYFIAALAVADLMGHLLEFDRQTYTHSKSVATMIMPFAFVLQVMGKWIFGPVFCTVWTSSDILCCTASILMLCAISLDRYWAISQPFLYSEKMTSHRCALIIAFIWLFSTVLALAQVLWRFIIESDSEKATCSYTRNREFRIVSSMSSFFVPLFIMVFTYCRILIIALGQARAIKMQTCNGGCNDANRTSTSFKSRLREVKAVKTVGIVMGCFGFCWIPFFVLYVLEVFCLSCNFPPELGVVFLWLGYVNSAMNPLIYFFFNRQYRRAFRKVLHSSFGCCSEEPNLQRTPVKDVIQPTNEANHTVHENTFTSQNGNTLSISKMSTV